MTPELQDDHAERQWVFQTLVAMIRDAEYQATLVASFLRSQGFKLRPSLPRGICDTPVPSGPAACFLLNLGAALRLHSWELAGLSPHLPQDLPTAAEALASCVSAAALGNGDLASATPLAARVFQVAHQHLAWAGRSELHTDIVMTGPATQGLLAEVAKFLWEHRHMAVQEANEQII